MNVPVPALLVICGTLIVIVFVLFWHPQRSQTKTSTSFDSGPAIFRDDERYWSGFLYNNPDDPALFVPKRFGLGWTVNFGHPQGKLVMIGMLLLPLVMLLLTVLLTGKLPTGCHPSSC